ncbi:trifunctional transcriptional regulator/proline dehydrogenase/L-glutamate gamma-semialdehyde dehydrogenase, partial [Proteus mirabilis]
MSSTTMGVRLDEETRNRLKDAAQKLDRTSHWLIKQAIFNYLEQIENDQLTLTPITQAEQDIEESTAPLTAHYQPFLEFAEQIHPQSVLRSAITSAYRIPETQAVPMLLQQATLPEHEAQATHKLAYSIAEKLRKQKQGVGRSGLVQGLLQEFSLSSQEGVALMCLAEALLRIPDKATRDALIR